MRQRTVISGAAAGAAILIAAGVAMAPRAWRRLRRGKQSDTGFVSDYAEPLGDPEATFDAEANAALREELRDKINDMDAVPEAPVATPVEPDLIVEGVSGADPAIDAARARLRQKAAEAKQSFRNTN